MKPKKSNILAKDALEALLMNGFRVAANDKFDSNGKEAGPRPTARKATRETRQVASVQRSMFTQAVEERRNAEVGRTARMAEGSETDETSPDNIAMQKALTSLSGKSVYLDGENAHTGQSVRIFLSVNGHLSKPAVQALQKQTGLTF